MNWNDPTFLRTASAVIQWFVIALASIAVCLQTAKHFVDLREKRITSERATAKEQAQREREQALQEKLDSSEKRIRSLVLELQVDIEAKWKRDFDPVGKGFMWSGAKAATILFLLKDGSTAAVEFGRPEGIAYTRLSPATVRLSYSANVLHGSPAYSLSPDQIVAVQTTKLALIGTNADSLEDTKVTITRLRTDFIANGRNGFTAMAVVRSTGDFSGAGSGTPELTLDGRTEIVHTK